MTLIPGRLLLKRVNLVNGFKSRRNILTLNLLFYTSVKISRQTLKKIFCLVTIPFLMNWIVRPNPEG